MSTPAFADIKSHIESAIQSMSIKDERYIQKQLDNLKRKQNTDAYDDLAEQVIDKAVAAVERFELRKAKKPTIQYNDKLPVSGRRDDIVAAITANQVVIIAGDTGSGKTTQLPKMCIEAGCGSRGLIGHTQPRRLAARTIAERLSVELQSQLGEAVGYQVRFTDHTSDATYIKQMTDGILLAETQHDRLLMQYDTIIIDEAHERSLNIDFLLGYIKQLLPKRPDLKVVVTSATIDVERFSKHFNDAPIIQVAGRTFPVDVVYLGDEGSEEGMPAQVMAAIRLIEEDERQNKTGQGDALVFLPGERDIREVALRLKRDTQHYDILPLYARLGQAEQARIFDLNKRRGRRIVLATNVAETSVTVPGIRYVIDSGIARVSRYSVRSKIQRLPIEDISKASANQRKGRCGRVSEGVCIRLYTEESFERRPDFTEPEILRTNLAAVILQMASLKLGDIRNFPFLEAPDKRLVNDGYKTLEEIGAIDRKRHLTGMGKQLSVLPVDPRIGRILLAAEQQGSLREMLIIASALSIQDPRERPSAKQTQADQSHARFKDKDSDFTSWLQLWAYLEEQRQALSKNQFNKLCKREYLAPMRVVEWRDIHHQLALAVKQLKLKVNSQEAGYEAIHKPLLSGFPAQMGRRDEGKQYQGARNREFLIFPASHVYKKPPAWLVSAELTETSKLYARGCARIEPHWALDYVKHLVKYSYSEPSWKRNQGQVVAKETVTLYGLVIAENASVPYGRKDAKVSREIFLRQALVERQLRTNSPFWRNNESVISEIESLEKKTRSVDYQINDDWLYSFYESRIPADIFSQRDLEKWLKQDKQHQQLLSFSRSDLVSAGNLQQDHQNFPDTLEWEGLSLPLTYEFSPGKGTDGVTVTVPVGVLNRVPTALFEWLVPGLLRDKCIALIKTLPKNVRKQLVPVPATVDSLMESLEAENKPLTEVISVHLKRGRNINIAKTDWAPDQLETLYRMRIRIIDAEKRLIAEGDQIEALVAKHRDKLSAQIQSDKTEVEAVSGTSFGAIAKRKTIRQAGMDIEVYPSLVDKGDGKTSIELLDDPLEAKREHMLGSARVMMMSLAQPIRYLRKELFKGNQTTLHFSVFRDRKAFIEEVLMASIIKTFKLDSEDYRDGKAFDRAIKQHKADLIPNAMDIEKALSQMLSQHYAIHQKLKSLSDSHWEYAKTDVKQQLAALCYDGVVIDTVCTGLMDFPRYFKALAHRMDKITGHFQKDKQATELLAGHEARLKQLADGKTSLHGESAYAEYFWMVQEYRVSLFAQQIKTKRPVSAKRLDNLWDQVHN